MPPPVLHDLLSHTTALRALARQLVGDALADDVMQEAAVQAIVRPPRQDGPTSGWLARVVRNLASKRRRAERTRHRHESRLAASEVEPADRSAEDADTLRAMTEAVTSLSEPYRQTILMRYLRELTPAEIAASTNTPVSTVKTRLQRGLELLRRRLHERDHDWRAAFVGAFATQSPVPSKAAPVMHTYNKIFFSLAVLVPVAIFLWWWDAGNMATPGAAQTAAADRSAAAAGKPVAGDAADDGRALAGGTAHLAQGTGVVPAVQADGSAAANQAKPPLRPVIRLDLVGPAAFRRAFAPTNLGALMASPEGEKVWRPLLAPVDKLWREWDARGEQFRETRERVLGFSGRVRVLWLMAPDNDGEQRMFGVFAIDMDEHTDLAALAGDVSRPLQAWMPGPTTKRTVAAREVELVLAEPEVFLSMPMVIDGRLVAFFGEESTLELAVTQGLLALAADVAAPQAPVSLDIDVAQLVRLSGALDDPVVAKMFGLESLQAVHARLRANGPRVELEVGVDWSEGERGIFAGLAPAVTTLPSMLSRVPARATPWMAAPLRPDVIFGAILEAAALADDGGLAGVRQSIYEELGMHLDTELFAHLGGEVMVLGDMWEADDRAAFQRGEDLPLTGCVAFSLKDTAAFAAGLDKVLNYLKGHVRQSDVRDVDGVKITKLGSMFVTGVHMAVGQDLFAVAIGEESVAQLEALVAGKRAIGQPPLPAAVLAVRHLAPKGWNAVGLTDLRALLGGQVGMAMEMLDNPMARSMGFDFAPEQTQAMLDALLPLIERHALGDLVTVAGLEERRWRMRLLW